MKNFLFILLIWNIIVMFIYGIDKLKAKRGTRRVRESTLITCAFAFGGWGGMFGMILFNHKTSKMKFRLLVPLAVILCSAAYWFIYNYMPIM